MATCTDLELVKTSMARLLSSPFSFQIILLQELLVRHLSVRKLKIGNLPHLFVEQYTNF